MNQLSIPRSRSGHATLARLRARAQRIMEREPDEIIGERYMQRWHSFKSALFSEYIHLYLGSDPTPWLHDHPWPSISICLRGLLREIREGPGGDGESVTIRAGAVSLRSARFAHRLELLTGPAVTLFIAGPRLRRWGFHHDTAWVHWRDATRIDGRGVAHVVLPPPGDAP